VGDRRDMKKGVGDCGPRGYMLVAVLVQWQQYAGNGGRGLAGEG
jgi:hypothetical protein